MKRTGAIVATILLLSVCAWPQELLVGAANRIITPDPLLPVSGGMGQPEPVTEKKGDLFARAIVMTKGGMTVALASVDLLGWTQVLGAKVFAAVPGIPKENIVIAATHCHSAPDMYAFPDLKGRHGADFAYLDWMCAKVAEAIDAALEARQPASLKIGMDKAAEKIAYNYYAPQLYDRRCGVIQAVANSDGKPICTLVNYASHPEVLGPDRGILSPDFCGPLYDCIERNGGGMGIYFNSAQGGMVTADTRRPEPEEEQNTWEECIRIGELLGAEALRIVGEAPVLENPALFCANRDIAFPLESKAMKFVLKRSPMKYPASDDGMIHSRLNLLNIGPAQILTIPGEALPNIGFYVKRHMPTDFPFLFGLTNDAFGYILTKVDWNSFDRYDYVSGTGLGEMTGEVYMEQALKFVEASPKPDPAPEKK